MNFDIADEPSDPIAAARWNIDAVAGRAAAPQDESTSAQLTSGTATPADLLEAAFVHLSENRFAEAVSVLNDLITSHPNASEARTAFTGLSYAYRHTRASGIIDFMSDLAGRDTPLSNEADLALARVLELSGDVTAARTATQRAHSLAVDDGYRFRARSARFLIEHHDRDFAEAERVLASMVPANRDEEEVIRLMEWLLELETDKKALEKNAPADAASF